MSYSCIYPYPELSKTVQDTGHCLDPECFESWCGASSKGCPKLLSGFEALSLMSSKHSNTCYGAKQELPESAPAYCGKNSYIISGGGRTCLRQAVYSRGSSLVGS